MALKPILLTPKGLQRIKDELEYLSNERRKEISEYMGSAIEDGDLRESAAYDEARMMQSQNETRIADLEAIIQRAKVIDPQEGGADIVRLGSLVHIKDEQTGEHLNFQIVGTHEADVLAEKISDESPLGQQLMDKTAGEMVKVQVGQNLFDYTLLSVSLE